MLDHVSLNVSDLAASRAFYSAALEPLAIGPLLEHRGAVGLGSAGHPYFWLVERAPLSGPTHIAFRAADRAGVDAFHAAALAAGACDNGAPGLRPEYHPSYYGAFVIDPDGNNVEAVCHTLS